jgi:2-oxoglutarate dehydrogenase E1 component
MCPGKYCHYAYLQAYFDSISSGKPSMESFTTPLSVPASHQSTLRDIQDHLKVQLLVRAYQVRGHHRATLDPLQISKADLDFTPAPELDIEYYGFTKSDLDREFFLGDGVLPRFRIEGKLKMRLGDLVVALKATYCKAL